MVGNRNLRRLVLGQFISAIGDQFYLIALPWLALQMTGEALTAGTLLAAASLPRTAFMLLGGAVTDRHSPKKMLLISNGLQAALMVCLAAAIAIPNVSLWILHFLAFWVGLVDAFGLPAFNSMLPGIVAGDELEGGNIYIQGANMASGVIGPTLAGILISVGGANAPPGTDLDGIALAFLINALTFLVGISFFWGIHIGEDAQFTEGSGRSLIASLRQVREHIGGDLQLKNLFFLLLVLGLFLSGAIRVGFPMLAGSQVSGGSVRHFGNMTSAFGAGLLLGMVGLRAFPKPPKPLSGIVMLGLFALVPIGLILLGFAPPIETSLAIIFAMGVAFGYVFIYLVSWLQRRTPEDMLGRVMAVVLFSSIGLSPVSQVLMAFFLDLNLRLTLIGVGCLMLLLLTAMGADRAMWQLEG
jgi:MFS family permease